MSTSPDNLRIFFESRLDRYLQHLKSMVEINSFTSNPQGVAKLNLATTQIFADLGFEAISKSSTEPRFGPHLGLTRAGTGQHVIAMVSHLDTVFPPEEELANDFHWRLEGDRIYGPGTVDIKGGTVMILMILEALQKFYPAAFDAITWHVLLNSSEETMSEDFPVFCQDIVGPGALGCLVFEAGIVMPTHYTVLTQRKGMAVFRVAVEGTASHAGSSHPDGANAIVQLAEVVGKIAALTDYEQDLTVNVGSIQGGTVTNRVPHQAQIGVEMRAFDMQIFDRALQQVRDMAGEGTVSSKKGYACQIEVHVDRITPPWTANRGSETLYKIWEQAASELGATLAPEIRGGLSDANSLWSLYPTLDALGPSGGNAHCSERSSDGSKDQEFLALPTLIPKAILNTMAIVELARAN